MAALSGNLPDELVVDILGRNPAKSLTRFNCVSKSWRILIGSTYFILKHLKNQAAISNHSLVFNCYDSISMHLLRRDDLIHGGCIKIRPPVKGLHEMLICAIGDGIIYFRAWSIGCCKVVVRLQTYVDYDDDDDDDDCWKERKKAEIWSSFDSESWREIDVNVHENLGLHLIEAGQLNIGGTCYWAGRNFNSMGEWQYVRFLVSFDMVNESFNRSSLPDELDTSHGQSFVMAELKQSLVVINVSKETQVEVWLMNNDDKHSSSWSKYYSLKAPWMLYPLGLCGDTGSILTDYSRLYFHNMITKQTISSRIPNFKTPLYLYKDSLVPL